MSKKPNIPLLLSAVVLLFAVASNHVQADLVVNNFNAQRFDGDGAGDTSDPILDPHTGTTVTFTTRSVTSGGTITSTTGDLGVNRGGGLGDRTGFFDDGEHWTFDADHNLSLTRVLLFDFSRAQSTANEDIVLMQSNDWIGLAGVNPEIEQVAFSSGTGTFTLTAISSALGNNFNFTLDRLTGGTALPISAGTDIRFTDASLNDNGWKLDILEFTTDAVPEPSSGMAIFLFAIAGIAGIRVRCS